MEIIYRASDGNEFFNEKDCLDYEKFIAEKFDLSNVIMLDKKMKVLSTDTQNDIIHTIEEVFYFSVYTEKDYYKVVNLFKEQGMCDEFPAYNVDYEGKQTVYVYDWDYGGVPDGWTNLNELCKEMTEKVAQIKQLFSL